MKARSFWHDNVEFKYDPRDMQILRTHWIFTNSMAYRSALKPEQMRRLQYTKHQKEHFAECGEYEAKNWKRLHPHWAPVSNVQHEQSLSVDGESYRIDTSYLLIPTRWQRLKRFISRGRWT